MSYISSNEVSSNYGDAIQIFPAVTNDNWYTSYRGQNVLRDG